MALTLFVFVIRKFWVCTQSAATKWCFVCLCYKEIWVCSTSSQHLLKWFYIYACVIRMFWVCVCLCYKEELGGGGGGGVGGGLPVFQGSFGCVFTCVKGHFVFVFHQQLAFTRLSCVTRTFCVCVSPAISIQQTCLCYKDILCVFHQQSAFTKVILTLFACITRKFVCVCVPPAVSIH